MVVLYLILFFFDVTLELLDFLGFLFDLLILLLMLIVFSHQLALLCVDLLLQL